MIISFISTSMNMLLPKALNLLKDIEVDAVIGPQKSVQAKFVIGLGDAAKLPIISFSATSPSLYTHPSYFVQTALNDAAQVDAIAAIVKDFGWSQVVFIYEDSDYGNGIIPYLSNAFQEVNARVSYRSIIPVSATEDFILEELKKMKTMQTRIFVVHLSSSLASNLFLKANEAEMMSEGYAWIVTSGLMDLFFSLDSHIVESMQGVLGVKPLVPRSRKLRSATIRWKNKFLQDNPGISRAEMNLFGLWAYDTLWALAMAAEKVGFKEPSPLQNTSVLNSTDMFVTEVSLTGPKLLKAISETTFQGLSGDFHLVKGQRGPSSFQILNVVGNKTSEVGIWTLSTRSLSSRNENATSKRLTSIMWPGKSTYVPKGWEVPVSGKKLRIGVLANAGFAEFVKVETDPQTNDTKVSGYIIHLFESVMAELPYVVKYEYFPFETTSSRSYDNLTFQVSQGNYDAAVGDITITAYRSQFVDFTLPIEEGGVTRTQKIKYENPNDKWIFWKPLRYELWLTAIALFIFTGVALWILEHRVNKAFRGPSSEHVGLIFYIPFMGKDSEQFSSTGFRRMGIRRADILNSTYTASLSARFTTLKLQRADTNINVLIRNGDYVGCREGSFIFDFLKNLGFNKSKIRTYNSSEEVDVDLSKGRITAFFSCTPYTDRFLSKYCNKYTKVGSPYHSLGFAFVFPKGSPLTADVSRAILNLTDDNRMSDITKQWIRNSTCNGDEPEVSSDKWISIDLESFKILFGITGGVTTTCLVVFLVSYLYQNRDFIHRISNSGATTWSKIRAICKHFDQRDPKSFRSSRAKEDSENASSDLNVYPPHHRSTVAPISSEEMPTENGAGNQSRQLSPT
ncbi:hypothetical protein DH2020_002689 [Rehmannia glutinosa]|uniref:Glutamate receptor n=1 Tax=Rehmannia glutinosa TaxID=99300 RepID=A0ABR0XUS1_REHGL